MHKQEDVLWHPSTSINVDTEFPTLMKFIHMKAMSGMYIFLWDTDLASEMHSSDTVILTSSDGLGSYNVHLTAHSVIRTCARLSILVCECVTLAYVQVRCHKNQGCYCRNSEFLFNCQSGPAAEY